MDKTFDELVDLLTSVIEKSASIEDDKAFEEVKNAIDAAMAILNKAEDAAEEDEEALLQEFSHAVLKAAELVA